MLTGQVSGQVDAVAIKLEEIGVSIDRGPKELVNSAPSYYYIVFEDPDGIRLEMNRVLGKSCHRKQVPYVE